MSLLECLSSRCRVATAHDTVLNSECAFTFHSPFTTDRGIVVNLNTFMGTIEELAFGCDHRDEKRNKKDDDDDEDGDFDKDEEGIFVRIVKKRVEKTSKVRDGSSSSSADGNDNDNADADANANAKPTKLGIGIDGGFQSEDDMFEIQSKYSIVVLKRRRDDDDESNSSAAPAAAAAVAVVVMEEVPYDPSTGGGGGGTAIPDAVRKSADSIIHHSGMAVQQDLKVWELDDEPKPISKYCETLPYVENGKLISPDPSDWKCERTGATENLWLNLSDGFIGGGRRNWDGSGGSNGALDHYRETGQLYPLVVKLGTITADVDTADCFSYAKDEDGPVKIPNLAQLLSKRGIQVGNLQKTAKSTAELEVELNATYAFDAITESGAHLKPVALQGLQNLGNSCYMASVVQLLLSGTVPELASRYGVGLGDKKLHDDNHAGNVISSSSSLSPRRLLSSVSPRAAPNDVLVQTAKLSHALTSGAFLGPLPESAVVSDAGGAGTDPKYRLQPRMFKHVIGSDHVDFRTGQQQDAAQFLQHLLEKLDRAERAGAANKRLPTPAASATTTEEGADGGVAGEVHVTSDLFAFKTTTRLVCSTDGRIKYKESAPETMLSIPVPMEKARAIVDRDDDEDQHKDKAGETMEDVPPDQKRPKTEERSGDADAAAGGGGAPPAEEEAKPVPTIAFADCLDSWSAENTVDDYRWPHLNNAVASAVSQTRLVNFPRYLLVQIQRYTLGADWTPQKLEVKLDIPEEVDVTHLKSKGPQEGENLVPDDDDGAKAAATAAAAPAIDEAALAQLMDMGFSFHGCRRALNAVGGSNVEAAMNWVFEHSTDPDFNDPLPDPSEAAAAGVGGGGGGNSSSGVDEGVAMSLVENLGCFTMDQVKAALKETNGAADRAADWLFSHMDDLDGAIAALSSKEAAAAAAAGGTSSSKSSAHLDDGEDGRYVMIGMVSHIGKHTGSGHYVAHLKREAVGGWVIFNDEKVALSESPPFAHAYLYLFQRRDTVNAAPNPNY